MNKEKFEEKSEKFEKKQKPSKIDVIKSSKMPIWQKKALIEELEGKSEKLDGKVPFAVYARIKKLGSTMQKAMLAYPGAKNVSLATVEEWDLIFKNF